MAEAYLATSLARLRREIDVRWPRRDRRSDGWIGDRSHTARKSDHNPDWSSSPRGVVRALDIDKDGVDVNLLLREFIADSRTSYVIWNRYIYDREYGFRRRRYGGENPHTHHMHISIRHGNAYEDSVRSWLSGSTPPPIRPPEPPEDDLPTAAEIAKAIHQYSEGDSQPFYKLNVGMYHDADATATLVRDLPDKMGKVRQGENPEWYDAVISTFNNTARLSEKADRQIELLEQILAALKAPPA